jgi:DNA-binding NtrC family response regulator
MKPSILLIDDDEATQFAFSKFLSNEGYDIRAVSSLNEARQVLLARYFDAVLLDMNLPDGSGLPFIDELRKTNASIAIVVITAYGDISTAVEAMQIGADNFLPKPVNMKELDVFLKKSLELGNLRQKEITLKRLGKKHHIYIGENPAMHEVEKLALLAAKKETPILLLGETGTGKGLLAQTIHEHSQRSGKSFVEVNCSGLKDEMLANELFGHHRGAYTTALEDQKGLLEVADGGTLFLDEISSMSLAVQAQLLKVIEEKRFRRLGETKVRRSEFRLICASNKNLQELVQTGEFRDDLFFRINVFPIQLPPLRDIPDNLPGLVTHILKSHHAPHPNVSLEVMQFLSNYQWPGNIRELRNVLERALLLADDEPLAPTHFPGLQASPPPCRDLSNNIKNLESFEKDYIKSVIVHFNNDSVKAAAALGISRASLYRKLKKFQDSQS